MKQLIKLATLPIIILAICTVNLVQAQSEIGGGGAGNGQQCGPAKVIKTPDGTVFTSKPLGCPKVYKGHGKCKGKKGACGGKVTEERPGGGSPRTHFSYPPNWTGPMDPRAHQNVFGDMQVDDVTFVETTENGEATLVISGVND